MALGRQVDLGKASITFTHQIATHGYRAVYKKVKTKSGARIIALDRGTTAELRAYQQRRQQWQQAAGTGWPVTVQLPMSSADGNRTVGVDLFFRQRDGQPWHPERVGRRFERAIRLAGLPPVRFHDGRHGSATYTKAAGGDLLDMKHKYGHSSVAVTGDVYPIVLKDLERELAERTAALIPRQGRPQLAGAATPVHIGQPGRHATAAQSSINARSTSRCVWKRGQAASRTRARLAPGFASPGHVRHIYEPLTIPIGDPSGAHAKVFPVAMSAASSTGRAADS